MATGSEQVKVNSGKNAGLTKRESLMYMVGLAEKTERYQDMRGFLKEAAEMEEPFNETERNLVAIAYKDEITNCRDCIRYLTGDVCPRLEDNANFHRLQLAKEYREKVGKKLLTLCDDVNGLVDKLLSKTDLTIDNEMALYKQKGDFLRYKSEAYLNEAVSDNDAIPKVINAAERAYLRGMAIAKEHFKPNNNMRLGLVLNASVFYCETRDDLETAITMADEALGDAYECLERDDVVPQERSDILSIIQLIEDNRSQWVLEYDERNRTTNVKDISSSPEPQQSKKREHRNNTLDPLSTLDKTDDNSHNKHKTSAEKPEQGE